MAGVNRCVSSSIELRTKDENEFIAQIKNTYGDEIKNMVKDFGPCYAAYELGLSVKDVKLVCTMLKIDGRRNGVIPDDMVNEWEREFTLCGSVKNIAHDWGVAPQTVRDALEERGINTRGVKKNENAMDKARLMFNKYKTPIYTIMQETGLTFAGTMLAIGNVKDAW